MIIYQLLLALIFLLLGGLLTYLVLQLQWRKHFIPRKELSKTYVPRSTFENLEQQLENNTHLLREKTKIEIELSANYARLQTEFNHLEENLSGQQLEMDRLQAASRAHFERIASQLLEEKSQRFTQQNAEQLNHLLAPLQRKIKSFEEQVERRFLEETRDRVSLKQEIKHLRALNQQLSTEANNLADALRGDNKKQ
ncbi:MAG: DNA recombination protein RmuC, partial [Bacteroidota bacterium]